MAIPAANARSPSALASARGSTSSSAPTPSSPSPPSLRASSAALSRPAPSQPLPPSPPSPPPATLLQPPPPLPGDTAAAVTACLPPPLPPGPSPSPYFEDLPSGVEGRLGPRSSKPEIEAVELFREWCWSRGVRLPVALPGLLPPDPPLNSAAAALVACSSPAVESCPDADAAAATTAPVRALLTASGAKSATVAMSCCAANCS
mmetsp:Transcript_14623/g.35767  ORF Transcript_14623/g.35767 Transcript_14623/m.35767 type:complete len:204 (-) Transcript_14623:883-1494(-)